MPSGREAFIEEVNDCGADCIYLDDGEGVSIAPRLVRFLREATSADAAVLALHIAP